MVKNKLEKITSKSLKSCFAWAMKLHNNPLSHQNTPADYIVSDNGTFALIECKQVTCKEGKGRLAFKRLKQLHDLLSFLRVDYNHHKAYFLIAYYDNRWDKSDVYLIPVLDVQLMIERLNKQASINREEAKFRFNKYRINYEGGELKFKKL